MMFTNVEKNNYKNTIHDFFALRNGRFGGGVSNVLQCAI